MHVKHPQLSTLATMSTAPGPDCKASAAAPCLQGCLIPPAHSAYWMGLTTNEEPKSINSWFWIDRSPPPTPTTYVKWGTRKPQNIPEPANLMGAETCGAANFSEAFAGTWGWASQQCKQELVYMCEQNREWRAQQLGAMHDEAACNMCWGIAAHLAAAMNGTCSKFVM